MDNFLEIAALVDRLEKSLNEIESTKTAIRYRYPGRIKFVELNHEFGERAKTDPTLAAAFRTDREKMAAYKRLNYYDVGSVPNGYATYIWVKRVVISDLGQLYRRMLNETSIFLPFVIVRPLLEHAGNLMLFEKELEAYLLRQPETPKEKGDALMDIHAIVGKAAKGTRINWELMLSKPMGEGKSKSYEVRPGALDCEAQGLMQGIDALNKKVKGVRKVYDFSSEFAHPNVGLHLAFVEEQRKTQIDEYVDLYERVLCRSAHTCALALMAPKIGETISIVADSISYCAARIKSLESITHMLEKWAQSYIRGTVQNDPGIFHKDEPCPCFSGKRYISCCGKKALTRGF